MSTPLLLTTHPGLEDLVAAELAARCAAANLGHGAVELRADGMAGRVRAVVEADREGALGVALGLRGVFHAMRPVATFALRADAPLTDIRERLSRVDLPELGPGRSFRVRCERVGEHPFTSEQVAAAAGAGILDQGPRPVRMKGFDVLVRCDVRGERVSVAVQHTHAALADRFVHVYNQRSSLKPTLAWGMLQLLGEGPVTRLLDPFCGAGTILYEAAAWRPGVARCGSDWSAEAVEGAGQNLDAAGVSAALKVGDALDLGALWDGPFDAVVTNPPFGLKLGAKVDFYRFYPQLIDSLAGVVPPGGRVAMLVWKRGAFNHSVWRSGGPFRSIHVRIVEMGNVFPGIFVLQRQ